MSPDQFKLIRNFFKDADAQMPHVVALMYQNFFTLAPETAPMFKENMDAHRQRFTQMFRRVIELMRSCHLWPVLALSGQAAIPGLEGLRCQHMRVNVTAEHYDKMKIALTQALETVFAARFTPEVRIAFSQMYDVLAHSMTCEQPQEHEEVDLLERFLSRAAPAPSETADSAAA
jgi:hemoglobin-like flavoprotein